MCQEVFPPTLPWGRALTWGSYVVGKQVVRQLLRENKGVAWVVTSSTEVRGPILITQRNNPTVALEAK